MYRDGVSEGEFERVRQDECAAIKRAIDEVWAKRPVGYTHGKPELCFIVVGKRYAGIGLHALVSSYTDATMISGTTFASSQKSRSESIQGLIWSLAYTYAGKKSEVRKVLPLEAIATPVFSSTRTSKVHTSKTGTCSLRVRDQLTYSMCSLPNECRHLGGLKGSKYPHMPLLLALINRSCFIQRRFLPITWSVVRICFTISVLTSTIVASRE
jgi:hypothetical protein